jgi:hypothetical protein
MEFERVLETFQSRVREAAQIPLPREGDADNSNDDLIDDDDDDEPILIVEAVASSSLQCHDAEEGGTQINIVLPSYVDGSSTTDHHFIPFESFLRLGESQIIEQQQQTTQLPHLRRDNDDGGRCTSQSDHHADDDNEGRINNDNHSDNDSVIPGSSFLNLGASMLAEASTTGPIKCSGVGVHGGKNDDDDDDDTTLLTEAGRSQTMDDSGVVGGGEQGQQSTITTTSMTSTVTASSQNSIVMIVDESSCRWNSAGASPTAVSNHAGPCHEETRATMTDDGVQSGVVPTVAKNTDMGALVEASAISARAHEFASEPTFQSKTGVEVQLGKVHELDIADAAVEPGDYHQFDIADAAVPPWGTVFPERVVGTPEQNVNNVTNDTVAPESPACENAVTNSQIFVQSVRETGKNAQKASSSDVGSPDDDSGNNIAPSLEENSSDCIPMSQQAPTVRGATLSIRPMESSEVDVETGIDAVAPIQQSAGERRAGGGTTAPVLRRQRPKPNRKQEQGYYPSSSLFVSRRYFSR